MRACSFGCALVVVLAAMPVAGAAPVDDETASALAAIKSIKREGKGNDDAGPAWKTLVSKGSVALLPALEAVDDANPTAANWFRTAVDAIVESETSAGHKLPLDKLEAFAVNPKFAALARLQAYELVAAHDPSAKARLLPGFLNDKSSELRRSAIEFELDKLEKAPKAELAPGLEKLFGAARDKDQIELIAKKLGDNGKKVSVSEHFGFVTQFALVGPFNSNGGKGFFVAYQPEEATDATGTYTGKADAKLTWKPAATTDTLGVVDLNKLLDKHKDAVAYALAIIVADQNMPCEIRVASPNSIQLFLNGTKLCEREEYHHGTPFDANIGKGRLKKGENVVVLKVCQNNQTEPWAQSWQFQLRVCDSTGGPLPGIKQRVPIGTERTAVGYIPPSAETSEEKKK